MILCDLAPSRAPQMSLPLRSPQSHQGRCACARRPRSPIDPGALAFTQPITQPITHPLLSTVWNTKCPSETWYTGPGSAPVGADPRTQSQVTDLVQERGPFRELRPQVREPPLPLQVPVPPLPPQHRVPLPTASRGGLPSTGANTLSWQRGRTFVRPRRSVALPSTPHTHCCVPFT